MKHCIVNNFVTVLADSFGELLSLLFADNDKEQWHIFGMIFVL